MYLIEKLKNISFYETGKAFLTSFGKRSQDISNKFYKPIDPEANDQGRWSDQGCIGLS
jgi:hypothetical protein